MPYPGGGGRWHNLADPQAVDLADLYNLRPPSRLLG